MSGFVYVLYSIALRRFYIGSTVKFDPRFKKHLAKHAGFTGKAKDWTVRLVEEYNSESLARRREKKLKGWKSQERMWQFIDRCHKTLYETCGANLEPIEMNA